MRRGSSLWPGRSLGRGRHAGVAALAACLLIVVVGLAGLPRVGEACAADVKPAAEAQWAHILRVVAALNEDPPQVPDVYLLGGSSALDSTISDTSWAAQVRKLGGTPVSAHNMGSANQTYAQDIAIVNQLPAVPSIVLIGVNLGRYTRPVAAAGAQPAYRAAICSLGRPHDPIPHTLSDAQKKAQVYVWLTDRYPLFRQNFAGNTGQLELLVAACQARGLHPVLLELPLNLPIVRHAFDKPRVQYRDSCRALAKKYTIPKINFLKRDHLVSSDFADLFHLLEPGCVKWQLRLSKTVVSLLARYGMESP